PADNIAGIDGDDAQISKLLENAAIADKERLARTVQSTHTDAVGDNLETSRLSVLEKDFDYESFTQSPTDYPVESLGHLRNSSINNLSVDGSTQKATLNFIFEENSRRWIDMHRSMIEFEVTFPSPYLNDGNSELDNFLDNFKWRNGGYMSIFDLRTISINDHNVVFDQANFAHLFRLGLLMGLNARSVAYLRAAYSGSDNFVDYGNMLVLNEQRPARRVDANYNADALIRLKVKIPIILLLESDLESGLQYRPSMGKLAITFSLRRPCETFYFDDLEITDLAVNYAAFAAFRDSQFTVVPNSLVSNVVTVLLPLHIEQTILTKVINIDENDKTIFMDNDRIVPELVGQSLMLTGQNVVDFTLSREQNSDSSAYVIVCLENMEMNSNVVPLLSEMTRSSWPYMLSDQFFSTLSRVTLTYSQQGGTAAGVDLTLLSEHANELYATYLKFHMEFVGTTRYACSLEKFCESPFIILCLNNHKQPRFAKDNLNKGTMTLRIERSIVDVDLHISIYSVKRNFLFQKLDADRAGNLGVMTSHIVS
ncbi:hypothetical protein GQ473_06800, partial [archaeon]|nr:hypothetical protein [archaeon]